MLFTPRPDAARENRRGPLALVLVVGLLTCCASRFQAVDVREGALTVQRAGSVGDLVSMLIMLSVALVFAGATLSGSRRGRDARAVGGLVAVGLGLVVYFCVQQLASRRCDFDARAGRYICQNNYLGLYTAPAERRDDLARAEVFLKCITGSDDNTDCTLKVGSPGANLLEVGSGPEHEMRPVAREIARVTHRPLREE